MLASLHSSWRFGKRNKLRGSVSQDPEDFYRVDPKKSTAENAYDIYKLLCSRDTRDTKRLFLLNALASLCLASSSSSSSSASASASLSSSSSSSNAGQSNLRFTTEELFYCLSASLVHTFTQVRAAALRTIRYVLATPKDIKIFNSMQLQHLLCRSIDLMLKNDDERVQGLKLVRKMLAVSPEDISPVVVRCLVSLADTGIEEGDNLLRACLATLSEFAVLNPTLLIVCGGVSSITRNVLECHNPRIAESLCGVLLYLLEWPQTRNICGVRLDCLAAPYCDFTYRLGIMDKNKDARELRYTSSRLALLSVLRSWTGTLEFCDPSKPSGLKAIVDALYLNQIEVRKAILDLLYELLGLPQPAWTDDYAVALQTVDPSDFQDSWLLSNGFVAAEGRSILPSLAARAPNVVEQHLALLLYCFLETGLLNALVEVIVSSDQHVSIRTTVLIAKIMHLMHTHLPADICSTSPALPTLISHATQGNQQASAAISALQTYQKMLRQRPASCSLFLDSIIQGGALVQTRLFRRDINAQEYAIAGNNLQTAGTSPIIQQLGGGGGGVGGLGNVTITGGTLDRQRLDSVSSSDESMSQSSSSIRSSFRLKRKFLPFFDNMRSLNRLIKDSNVLSLPDANSWEWEVVTTILRSNLIRKMDDTTGKFLKRLVEFFKPSSNRFSHQDLVLGPAMPAYVPAGLDLIDVLLNGSDLESMRLITDLFSDISQHLMMVTTSNRAHDCLFSPQHMNNTMCQQYFLFIGRMCRVKKGIIILTNTGVFVQLGTLVRNTDHVCYVKLIVSGLHYSGESPEPRKVLEKALTTAKTRTGRLYATQFLAVLLRARQPNFEVWGIPMIIQQTKDSDRSVVLAAMDVMEEACHEKYYLEEIVSLWPNFKALGDVGRLLMARYYSLSRGLNNRKAKIKEEIEYWRNGYNKRYVLLVEADTHSSLTLHIRNEDGYYSRRNCNTRPIIVPPNIAPHLYGQMVQTTQGMTALRKFGDLVQLIEVVSRGKCTDDTECIELKAAIWAVAHASTHSNGIDYFIESGSRIYEKLILLVTKCEVYSIRATCFSALGLIAGTIAGANILFKLDWLSVRHDRNTIWPVHQPEDWMSSNYTPVRHHYEDMPPYNYTGIEDQIDGSYYTGSYWNLLLSSNSTTKGVAGISGGGGSGVGGGGGTASASSEAQDANTTTDSVRTTADELQLQPTKALTVNVPVIAAKSKTLPEGTYMRQGKHQRSLSESKTMEVFSLFGGMHGPPPGPPGYFPMHNQHRIRYNSCTDSNTSGVSSCESVTGRTAAAAVGDFQQFPLSPIPSMSNLLELPQQQAKLLRRTSLLGTTYLQQVLSPLDIKGYAQLRSLRAHSRPVFSESAAELYDYIDIVDRTEFRPRKSSFGESQRRIKVRSLDRQTSLKVFTRLSSEELQVPLPTLNTPKFLSQNDSKGPCYSGICLPKNPLDVFPTRNLTRTYVSRDIQDQDLMDINLLTAKQQFLNDSLNNEGGDESSVISSLSDVSSVSKRTKWHQMGAKHGRSQCLHCARSRRNQRTHTLRIDGGGGGGVDVLVTTTTITNGGGMATTTAAAASALPGPAPCELYSSATAALVAAGMYANIAISRKGGFSTKQSTTVAPLLPSHQQQHHHQSAQSSSTIQLSDISFNSPESILSEESMPDRITASILYNVQRLANPVSAKQSKMSLLELKQKHPNTFQDICLYSEACKTLGRSSYRMSARRFLQELFLDLNFDSFYVEPQEVLNKKSKLGYNTTQSSASSSNTTAAERTEVTELGSSQNMELTSVMMVEQSMSKSSSVAAASSSSTPTSSIALNMSMASNMSSNAVVSGIGHKSCQLMKSKPLASVYETSCENLLIEQSPRFNVRNVNPHRETNNELHITTDEDDDKGGGGGGNRHDDDGDLREQSNDDVDDGGEDNEISTQNTGGEDVYGGTITTHTNLSVAQNYIGIGIGGTNSISGGGNGGGNGGSSNCSDQTTNSNRSSICTISHQPTATTMPTTTTTPTMPPLENENKKYTRGRFYTLELDLSCTKNKFPITDRNRTAISGASAAGAITAIMSSATNTNLTSSSLCSMANTTTPVTFTLTSPTKTNFLLGSGTFNNNNAQQQGGGSSIGSTSTDGGGGGISSVMSSEPFGYKRQSSLSDTMHAANLETDATLLMMVAPTLNSLTVTKSLAASMVKPVGSLFCEKRLQTSKSEAILMNVTNRTVTTPTNSVLLGVGGNTKITTTAGISTITTTAKIPTPTATTLEVIESSKTVNKKGTDIVGGGGSGGGAAGGVGSVATAATSGV